MNATSEAARSVSTVDLSGAVVNPPILVTTAIPMRGPGGRFSPIFLVTRDGETVGFFPTAAKARAFVARGGAK